MTTEQLSDSVIASAHLLDLFPKRIRKALISDSEFSTLLGIPTERFVTLGDTSFRPRELYRAIAQAYDDPKSAANTTDTDNVCWRIRKSNHQQLSLKSESKTIILWDHRYLSSNTRRRLNGLKNHAQGVLPRVEYERFEAIIKTKMLSEAEMEEFNGRIARALVSVQKSMLDGFTDGALTWEDLVPRDVGYRRELLFGLSIENFSANPEACAQNRLEFVPDVAPLDIAKRWLHVCASRELSYSLADICSLDLSEYAELNEWALNQNSPAILCAYLDYLTFSAAKLRDLEPYIEPVLNRMVEMVGIAEDWFEVFAKIFRGVYGFVSQQGWFRGDEINQKRLFVWGQANLIMSSAPNNTTLLKFADWANNQMFDYCLSALTAELKEMPRWGIAEMSSSALFADLVGRSLLTATQFWGDERASKYLNTIAQSDAIEAAYGKGVRAHFFRPGILEGSVRKLETLSAELLDVAFEQVRKRPFTSDNLIVLANTIPLFVIPDELVGELIETLEGIPVQFDGFANSDANFYTWSELAMLAVERQDTELAMRVAESVWKSAVQLSDPMPPKQAAYLFVILSFGVDFESEHKWLKDRLAGLALRVSDKSLAFDYFGFLRSLRSVRPELEPSISAAFNNLRLICQM